MMSKYILASIAFFISFISFARTFDSKKCGQMTLITEREVETIENTYHLCREDNALGDNGIYTRDSKTKIYVSAAISESFKTQKKIIDHVLLQELIPYLKEKLRPLDKILALPDSENIADIKKDVLTLKNELLQSDLSPRKQISRMLNLYPDLLDNIYLNSDTRPLACRYLTKQLAKQKWAKIFKLSGKILTALLTLGSVLGGGAGLIGLVPLPTIATLAQIGGITNLGISLAEIGMNLSDLGPTRAGTLAKNLLKIDEQIEKELSHVQKQTPLNKELIINLQSIRLSPHMKNELLSIKDKRKNQRTEILGAGLRVLLSSVLLQGSSTLKNYLGDYDKVDNVDYINPIDTSTGGGSTNNGGDDGG